MFYVIDSVLLVVEAFVFYLPTPSGSSDHFLQIFLRQFYIAYPMERYLLFSSFFFLIIIIAVQIVGFFLAGVFLNVVYISPAPFFLPYSAYLYTSISLPNPFITLIQQFLSAHLVCEYILPLLLAA